MRTQEMMNTKLRQYFQRFLAEGAFCTPPGRAACALEHARTVLAFEQAESDGLVRLCSESEQESFADVFGDEIYENGKAVIERWGCWVVYTEVNINGEWEMADSIGMCVYANPTDAFENCYVPDLMAKALEMVKSESQERQWAANHEIATVLEGGDK